MNILVIGGGGFQRTHMIEPWLAVGHDLRVLNSGLSGRRRMRAISPTTSGWCGEASPTGKSCRSQGS